MSVAKRFLAALLACFALAAQAQVGGPLGGQASTTLPSSPVLAPDGSKTAPSYSWLSAPADGMYHRATGYVSFAAAGIETLLIGTQSFGGGTIFMQTIGGISFSSADTSVTTADVAIFRDAANTLAQKSTTNAQSNRLYFSTTGPVYWQQTARTAGMLYTAVGGAAQVSLTQTTVPTCTTNCGTSPSVAGTDTAMRVTMGASGVPASAWVVQFNGTWPSAPVCHVTAALATMVVGKMAIAVVTTTTTITVTTNGTAPGTSDQYAITCFGVS